MLLWDLLRPETESCAEQELPVPLQISLNVVSDGLVSPGRSLCVFFLALCAEIWRLDHIICICITQESFAFSLPCMICSAGCGGDGEPDCRDDVDLVCLILTRPTAQQPENILQVSCLHRLCHSASVTGLTSAQSERLGPIQLLAKWGEA